MTERITSDVYRTRLGLIMKLNTAEAKAAGLEPGWWSFEPGADRGPYPDRRSAERRNP